MTSWDFINTSPTMEVFFEAKRDGTSGACKSAHCPRLRLTWYITKDWIENFISNVLPIVFVVLANCLNGFYCLPGADDNFGDPVADDWTEEGVKDEQNLLSAFFANELTLALTLVFMIPQLRSKALSNEASSIDVFISLLFFGLILGIFAGINRCDWIAEGVVRAVKELELTMPLVVRLSGTNVEEGKRLIAESGLPIHTAETLADAADLVVRAWSETKPNPAKGAA